MEEKYKKILLENGFTFKKSFGQNFLSDEELLSEIVKKANVKNSDCVLEIGCGAGALTYQLCKVSKRVIGYEIDQKLKPILTTVLNEYNNVSIIYKDILKCKLEEVEKDLDNDYILVANLPYYITTPIITLFLENSKKMKSMVIMVQEEVADRLCAKPSTSDYGAITIAVNLRGNASKILRVDRSKFTPIPNVDSAVVKIDLLKDKYPNIDYKKVRNLVKCGFNNRRKMFVNNLMKSFGLSRNDAENLLNSCDIPLTCRGENLSELDYIKLSEKI